jgi:hypothetical protein
MEKSCFPIFEIVFSLLFFWIYKFKYLKAYFTTALPQPGEKGGVGDFTVPAAKKKLTQKQLDTLYTRIIVA